MTEQSLTCFSPRLWQQAGAGYHALLFDGPGQGAMLYESNIPLRADWETVVGAVVDFALTLPQVYPEKLIISGWNGLTAVETGSRNYNFVDTPTFAGGSGFGGGVGVQISALATPEPSMWVMMGLGFARLGFAAWRAKPKTTAHASTEEGDPKAALLRW
jgi:hypothetical protein